MKKSMIYALLLNVLCLQAQAAPTAAISCDYKIPVETEKVEQPLVLTWAENAAIQSFALSADSIDKQLEALQSCYTELGWAEFMNAMNKSGNLAVIKNEGLIVRSRLDGESNLIRTDADQWKINLPIKIVYQKDGDVVAHYLNVYLTVGRKVTGELGIMQMIATPRFSPTKYTPLEVAVEKIYSSLAEINVQQSVHQLITSLYLSDKAQPEKLSKQDLSWRQFLQVSDKLLSYGKQLSILGTEAQSIQNNFLNRTKPLAKQYAEMKQNTLANLQSEAVNQWDLLQRNMEKSAKVSHELLVNNFGKKQELFDRTNENQWHHPNQLVTVASLDGDKQQLASVVIMKQQQQQQQQRQKNNPSTPPAPINCDYKIPSSTKTIGNALVQTWAEHAAVQSFIFNADSINMQLDKLQACYTNEGWNEFKEAMVKSGNIVAIKEGKIIMTSQLAGQTQLVSVKEGEWKVRLPLQVTYQNQKERVVQGLNIDLVIGRKPSGDLGIMHIVASLVPAKK
ncbi:Macrophage killing protein with similarity to conjugation protein [Legionella massiliensis]|uniref:Macrophage killing protein with similarity to conjugation protein n=1 Tax=Legionella massiliensis TaxID=1034943 RepID=A0A078KZH7_9GAMM|nr:DotI/IcmL family type IV secretion protein [Legionella massiliensis]CDZ78326.1 Macrophage killing protein with similarity to conjugation protein [Legionella massiliensis]CEE14064.1 Macrophage killing protein with similarity to conjugation protein [Legionella massiliensis]